MSQQIKSHTSNNNYRNGWDRIFGRTAGERLEDHWSQPDWTTGKTINEILAIRFRAKATSKSPEEIVRSGEWKAN